jgi:HAD superfamily phosphatase (TIGR01668 family)
MDRIQARTNVAITLRALSCGHHSGKPPQIRILELAQTDWWSTTRQAVPNLGTLLRNLRPTMEVASVREIDPAFVERHQVEAFIWDVDGTMMGHHDCLLHPDLLAVVQRLWKIAGLSHAILSNCGEERFAELGGIFPDIPIFKGYRSNGKVLLRKLLQGQETWLQPDGNLVEKPAGILTPLKKPSAELIARVLVEIGRPDPARVYMVGDQYFTDIAGANLAGINSIKVTTVSRATFPLLLRTFQRVESIIVHLMGQKKPVRSHLPISPNR